MSAGPAHAAEPTDIVINEMMTKSAREPPAGLRTGRRGLRVHRALQPRRRRHRHLRAGPSRPGISLDPASNPLNTAGTFRVFPPDTIVHSHQYFVGSSNVGVFNTVSGQTADFSFAPSGLSSSGENVTLVDAAGATVESFTYSTTSGTWPSLPNGLGPSLELTDPFANPNVGGNWGVSATSVGTPHAQNSSFGPPPPNIANVAANPAGPTPDQDVIVQAKLPKGIVGHAHLQGDVRQRRHRSPSRTTPSAAPTTASTARSIPHQAAGNLIRYKISATTSERLGA